MKDEFNIYGKRLSAKKAEQMTIALYSQSMPEEDISKAELNINIDKKFGEDFPPKRRDELWAAKQRLEKKRQSPAWLTYAVINGKGNPLKGAFQIAVNEMSTALNDKELVHFLSGESDKDLVETLVKNKKTPKA